MKKSQKTSFIMRSIFSAFIVLTLFSQPAFADIALCESAQPSTSVRLQTRATKHIRTQSSATLTNMQKSEASVGGLGGGEIGIKTQGRFIIKSQGAKACVSLKNFDVTFYAKPRIMVASNFRIGTCEYHAVLAHEQKHVRTLLNFVRLHTPRLRREVKNVVRSNTIRKVVPAGGTEQAQQDILNRLANDLQSYQDSIMPTLEREQLAIDTPEEYARVSKMCRNWDEKLNRDNNNR